LACVRGAESGSGTRIVAPRSAIVAELAPSVIARADSAFAPYVDKGDDRLASVCQVSIFFALVSAITLRLEYDSSAHVLGVLLVFTLVVPPVLAFVFQSDIDWDEILHVSAAGRAARRTFDTTVGRCIERVFKDANEAAPSVSPSKRHLPTRHHQSGRHQIGPQADEDTEGGQPVPMDRQRSAKRAQSAEATDDSQPVPEDDEDEEAPLSPSIRVISPNRRRSSLPSSFAPPRSGRAPGPCRQAWSSPPDGRAPGSRSRTSMNTTST
jgi:hypothetical protein